jgi:hypothetical protein
MNRYLLGLTAFLLVATSGLHLPVVAAPMRPGPPAARKVLYDPNQDSCTPQAITLAYQNHLKPWADQPEPVLARLRVLQAEMTRTSLARCIEQGLMSADQAREVEGALGLDPSSRTASTSQTTVRP